MITSPGNNGTRMTIPEAFRRQGEHGFSFSPPPTNGQTAEELAPPSSNGHTAEELTPPSVEPRELFRDEVAEPSLTHYDTAFVVICHEGGNEVIRLFRDSISTEEHIGSLVSMGTLQENIRVLRGASVKFEVEFRPLVRLQDIAG